MLSIFVGLAAAWAEVLYSLFVSREVSVAAIEVGYVAGGPVLEGLGKSVHDFAHIVPIDVIE